MSNPQPQPAQQKQIQIKATDEALVPKYANAMQVTHSKEEFQMDFLHLAAPHGMLTGRVVVSPGHFKRMIAAMIDNLKRYETQFGTIGEASAPQGGEIGFQSE